MISLIAAFSLNRIIGENNSIPWYLPADLEWFKQHTLTKPVIMGRCTWETIRAPLPGRLNIIMSRYLRKSTIVKWVTSVENALMEAKGAEEVMVIGGSNIYNHFILLADRLYLTHINTVMRGDSYFPQYNYKEWHQIFSKNYHANQCNQYDLFFEILVRS
ncbi:type 3 dihydrofolate reductase [Candidatus Erwinia haradaeae]|uniref:Dihydrofolate reductase n=1 Tax=Candidatus Erwinia haradaeae TaxID=1922217 RepID=A0A451D525_9GAMM|nr:type 3 dihydrofolate reductase [Candidatus Erwinia haradaeae]VFP80694.1 Dihydrofolate reductase [Candidatus Erwinia haradaeae]